MVMHESRRGFLVGACATAGALVLQANLAEASVPKSPNGKALAGVFPIGWTPCTRDNKLDTDAMVREMQFLNRGKVAGMAWPQNASGWKSLTTAEWNAGAEAFASVKGRTALVLGVQSHGFDTTKSVIYAKTARRLKADGIMSIMPQDRGVPEIIAYFKAISDASGLPVIVQAIGNTSVESITALAKALPTVVAVKDEAGHPLENGPVLLKRTNGKLEVFSGGGGMHFFPEMELGFTGTCPYTGLADLLQLCFNQFMAGQRSRSYDNFGRFLAFNSLPHANEYVMVARGVFTEDLIMRQNPGGMPGAHHGGTTPITDAQKADIRQALNTYLKPYLVA